MYHSENLAAAGLERRGVMAAPASTGSLAAPALIERRRGAHTALAQRTRHLSLFEVV